MKKLLIVSETWYPDSRATIDIMGRIAAGIAEKGIEIYALPLKGLRDGGEYPAEHDKITVIRSCAVRRDKLSLKWRRLLLKGIQKLLYAENHLLLKGRVCSWNDWVLRLKNNQRSSWYQPLSEQVRNISAAQRICAAIDAYKIDSVISVSLPFWIQSAAALAVKAYRKESVDWVPVSFDPYAYDESISRKEQQRRVREEHRTFCAAKKILMLSQSEQDYQSNSIREKMDFFEIPNIRKQEPKAAPAQIQFVDSRIHCVFIGNLYWTVRNPESLFALFEQFSDDRICLHVIGSLSYDFPESYMAQWEQRLQGRLTYHNRISSEDAIAVMNQADILVNIGNTTTNQCPSKVLEYISMGKPVLSISKIRSCTSAVYLGRYPLARIIREEDCFDRETIQKTEEYILKSKGSRIGFEEVEALFCDCTNEQAVEHVIRAFM